MKKEKYHISNRYGTLCVCVSFGVNGLPSAKSGPDHNSVLTLRRLTLNHCKIGRNKSGIIVNVEKTTK